MVLDEYVAALQSAPLSDQTRRTYESKVRQFLAWLAQAAVDGDPLNAADARDCVGHAQGAGGRRVARLAHGDRVGAGGRSAALERERARGEIDVDDRGQATQQGRAHVWSDEAVGGQALAALEALHRPDGGGPDALAPPAAQAAVTAQQREQLAGIGAARPETDCGVSEPFRGVREQRARDAVLVAAGVDSAAAPAGFTYTLGR